jgi:hypothetical protein
MAFCSFNLFLPSRVLSFQQYYRAHPDIRKLYGDRAFARKGSGIIKYSGFPEACGRDVGEAMSKKTVQKTKKKAPKVRSYVRPTRVHTPEPKRKPKYPDREIEEELGEPGSD